MKNKKQFNLIIEAVRIVAILGVILIHTTTRSVEFYNFKLIQIPFTVFLNQIARFAVPVFFIVSGFVLSSSNKLEENYFYFIYKRISRILIPYLFWSGIYYYFVYWQNSNTNFIHSLILGNASYQLYFIPSLMILYLAFPLFIRLLKSGMSIYILISLFVIQTTTLYLDYYIKPFLLPEPIKVAILNTFMFAFGIYISDKINRFVDFFKRRKYYLFLFIIPLAYVFKEGYFGYISTSNYLRLYSQWRPSIMIYSILLFLSLYYLFNRINVDRFKVVKELSSLSYLVFYIHVIILEKIFFYFPKIATSSILFFVCVASVSFVVAELLHRVPKLHKFVG